MSYIKILNIKHFNLYIQDRVFPVDASQYLLNGKRKDQLQLTLYKLMINFTMASRLLDELKLYSNHIFGVLSFE